MSSKVDGRIFLGGELVDGASVEAVRAPFDGSVVAEVHRADARLIDAALERGAQAAPVLAAMPAHARRAVLRHISSALRARADEVARLIVAEAGKPLKYARAEVERGAQTFDFAADAAGRHGDEALALDAAPQGTGRYGVVRRIPAGLVVAIAPFNFPLNLVAHKLAPAFAAGCPVVLKPASQTPLTALLLAHICREAGLPAGGLSVVPSGRAAADLLVTDGRPRVLSFTGSAAVGWDMKARAGKKRVVLELGGDAAAVLLDDADLDVAIPRIATGAFAYAGQICISVQRVLVARRLYDEVKERLVAHTRTRIVTGDPASPDVDAGPLIDAGNAARVLAWIDEAVGGGARVLCGGTREENAVAPTLLEGVPAAARLATEEAFGPVALLEPIDDVEHAIARVNASRYGLQVGVFTDSLRSVMRFWESCEVGAVIHNDAPIFRVDHMPYGGVKDSGFGREGLPFSLDDYTEPRLLALRP
jgi:acyl-CoA reductase-like NAD-dependent aldehyde dehydrogenase